MIVTTGLGKSKYPAMRLADTLCGIDVPAAFVHPAEVTHGLGGLIRASSRLIAFSQSGSTREVIKAAKYADDYDIPVLWVSGAPGSGSWTWINTEVEQEGDPFDLNAVPLRSIVQQEHAVNVIICEYMEAQGFDNCRYALTRNHTGGAIGESLR